MMPGEALQTEQRAGGVTARDCLRCGYSLEGLPDVGSCPECGNEYHRLSPVLHVVKQRYCAGCAFDLKGLPRDGACPECGTPIAGSSRCMHKHNAAASGSLVLGSMSMLWALGLDPFTGFMGAAIAAFLFHVACRTVRRGAAPRSTMGIARAGLVVSIGAMGISAALVVWFIARHL